VTFGDLDCPFGHVTVIKNGRKFNFKRCTTLHILAEVRIDPYNAGSLGGAHISATARLRVS